MSKATRARNAGLLGALLAVASLLAFPSLASFMQRSELALRIEAPDVTNGPLIEISGGEGKQLYVDGSPASLSDPVAPGLHRIAWKREYRGGHTRSVTHAQLVGPLQQREHPTCSVSLLIAPSFLEQTAPILEELVSKQLNGMKQWPIGKFKAASKLNLRWVAWTDEMPFRMLRLKLAKELPEATIEGHLRVAMAVEFENAHVPLALTVVPLIKEGSLTFRVFVSASLDLDNRLFQWVADFFDGNDRVSELIEREVRREMRNVLDKPPNIAINGDTTLEIEFCEGEQLHFHEAGHVAMPLALRIAGQFPGPPLHPKPTRVASPAMTTPLAVELDRNALGTVLHTLWDSGMLDRTLARTTVRAFNEHPTVRDFLSLRIDSAQFHLPPTIDFQEAKGLQLRAASKVTFRDGDTKSNASLFAEFTIASEFIRSPSLAPKANTPGIELKAVQLTCSDDLGRLRPCYSQIIAQVRANQAELQEQLATLLRDLLLKLFTQRTLKAPGAPASYQLESTDFDVDGARLRANLRGVVER